MKVANTNWGIATKLRGTMNEAGELKDYRDGVRKLFELNSPKIISNSMPGHAAILFEAFFDYAQDHVLILCRHLNAEVFDREFVVDAAKRALNRNVLVSILTQEEPQAKRFVDAIEPLKLTKKYSLERAATEKGQSLPFNFAVMDERAFRFEGDRGEVQAEASMNCPQVATRLVKMFEELSPVPA
jgi:hypothetical protein